MFTIDASVHISALNPVEQGSLESQRFLARVHESPLPTFSPTLLLVKVAAAVARVFDSEAEGLAMAQAIRGLPEQVWVPLDDRLAVEAAQMAARHRLRGQMPSTPLSLNGTGRSWSRGIASNWSVCDLPNWP